MRLRLQIALTLALAAVVGGTWVWLAASSDAEGSNAPRGKRSAATRVLVEPVTLGEDKIVVRAIGTGDAHQSAALYPKVSGVVVDVGFKPEQTVDKGAVLVRLDDEHQRLAVRLASVALRKAQRDVERLKKLASSGHASRARLDTAQTDLEAARVRHAQAQAELADRRVIAPFAGVMGLTDISVGDRVDEDTLIATLDDRATIFVDFSLPEDHAARVAIGQPVTVRPSARPEAAMEGTVSALASRIDPRSRTLRLRASIPNRQGRIRPGTSFEVELAFTGRAYPRIREVAVLWSRDGAYLWRATANTAEKVFVKLVRRDRGRILVDGPLAEGELVVVEGVQGLRPGQRLEPRPFGQPDPAARTPEPRRPAS